MATSDSSNVDMRKLRRKKKSKRLIKRILSVLAVFLVIFCLYLSSGLWLPKLAGVLERNYWTAGEAEVKRETFPIDISQKVNTMIGSMDDCLAVYSDTYLTTVNSDGKQLFSSYLPYSNPVIETSARRTLIYDMGGTGLSVVSKKSEAFSKKLDNQIHFAKIGLKGNVAVVTATEKFPSYLTVYDKNGNEIYHWADGNYITAVALSSSGDGCLIATSYASKGTIRSTITELDFSKSEITAKTKPVESMILTISYTSDGGFWAIGDNAFYRYSKDLEQEFFYDYRYDISGYAVGGDVCAVECLSIDGKYSYLTVSCADGDNTTHEQAFDEKINHIEIIDDSLLVNTPSRLYKINRMGERLESSPLSTEYITFAVRGKEAYFMGYRSIDKIDLDVALKK